MSRVAVTELVFENGLTFHPAKGAPVYVYDRGTTTEATLYAAETGTTTVEQPLLTDAGGRPEHEGSRGWVNPGSYDLSIEGETVPWEAAKGAAAGGEEPAAEEEGESPTGDPSFRKLSMTPATAGTTLVFEVPSGSAEGDTLHIGLSVAGEVTIATPAGWTQIYQGKYPATPAETVALFELPYWNGETQTYTVAWGGASKSRRGAIVSYDGASPTAPRNATGAAKTNNDTTEAVVNGLTTTIVNCLLATWTFNSASALATPGSGWTEGGDQARGPEIAHRVATGAAVQPGVTHTLSEVADSLTVMVALQQAQGSAPDATTNVATAVSGKAATLNGEVDPNGQATTWWYEYGTTESLGTKTTVESGGSGTSPVSRPVTLSSLSIETKYYFRLVALNPGGIDRSAIYSFTTTVETPKVASISEYFRNGGSTSVTLGAPSGVAKDDLLIAVMSTDGTENTFTAPVGDGWAQIKRVIGSEKGVLEAWWKLSDGSGEDSYAFTQSNANGWVGIVVRVTGHALAETIAAAGTSFSATAVSTLKTATITTTEPGSLVLSFFQENEVSGLFSENLSLSSAGAEEIFDLEEWGQDNEIAGYSETKAAAGTIDRTVTVEIANQMNSIIVGINPGSSEEEAPEETTDLIVSIDSGFTGWSVAEEGYRTALAAPLARHQFITTDAVNAQDSVVEAAWKMGTKIQPLLGGNELGDATAYKTYVLAFIARYKPGGTFWSGKANPLGMTEFELGNEPYFGGMTVTQYATAIKPTLEAVLSGGSGAHLLLCSRVNGNTWVQVLYEQISELNKYFYAFANHPYWYGHDPTEVSGSGTQVRLELLRSIMNEKGAEDKPIWVTEWGQSTANCGSECVSEATQQIHIEKMLAICRKPSLKIECLSYYQLIDRGTNTASRELGFGILRQNGTLKPGYTPIYNAMHP